MVSQLTRRGVLAAFAALTTRPAWADQVIDLEWSDLLPKSATDMPKSLRGIIEHDGAANARRQPKSSGVRRDWNGRIVRLPGFIVPVETKGTAVTSFILVPYVGACIHVPPPPANQLVFVTTDRPYDGGGMFEPVNVTGMFGVAPTSTSVAEIGYALSADKIEPFGG